MISLEIYIYKKGKNWKTNYKAIVGTDSIFFSFFFFSFFIRFALTEFFLLVGNPAGGPATERCLAAGGAALIAKAPSKDTPPPSSLLGFSKDPPRSCIGSCRLPGLGDD